MLIEACRELGVPVLASEQYPQGLGPTVTSLAAILGEDTPGKLTFSCARDDGLKQGGRGQRPQTDRRHRYRDPRLRPPDRPRPDRSRAIQVYVPHDAVNSRRPADKEWALHRMAAAGAVITSTESALFELLERCDTSDFKTVAKLIKKIPV